MRVVVLGAGGKLGSRLCAALAGRGHTPVAFVRDKNKFESSIPKELLDEVESVQGDAESFEDVKKVLEDESIGAFINCAGKPSATDGKGPRSNQGDIGMNIIEACLAIKKERGKVVRGWWVTGLVMLDEPGTKAFVHDRIIEFRPEHRPVAQRVLSIPTDDIEWTILCPSLMFPGPESGILPSSYPMHSASTSPSLGTSSQASPESQGRADVVLISDTLTASPWLWTLTRGLLWLRNMLGSRTPFVMMPLVLWHAIGMGLIADVVAEEIGEGKWVGKRLGVRKSTVWERWGWV